MSSEPNGPNTELEKSDSNKLKSDGDSEKNAVEEKIRYPYSVFFIVSNEFCERFSFYGMRTILSLYLTNILMYSTSTATVVYHAFTSLVYFFPLLGAIISDSWLGKFRTIFYVSIIYAAGNIILTLGATGPLNLPQEAISILGLLLIAIGTGGIKPCVSAFGGDQFVLPQQEAQLARFFSLFYFSINAGSLISTFLTPELRETRCFDSDSCYPLAFAVPGILMIISVIIFGLGKRLYKKEKIAEGNITVKVSKCIGHALVKKIKSDEKKEHWIDHAQEKYGPDLVRDVKVTLKVLILYVPLPIFWALYDQQGTAWTFQAVRMSGDLGFYTILPDQMQVVNPLLILAFIPLFDYGVYPLLAKCRLLKTSLQRMACGGFLAALAFVISALISMAIEATDPVLPVEGIAQLRMYNSMSCELKVNANYSGLEHISIGSMNTSIFTDIKVDHKGELIYFDYHDCSGVSPENVTNTKIKDSTSYLAYFNDNGLQFLEDDISKDENGFPLVRAVYDVANTTTKLETTFILDTDDSVKINVNNSFLDRLVVSPGKYKLDNGNPIEVKLGGVYTILIDSKKKYTIITVTEPNSVNMLLQIPQYVIITSAEILLSVTGLQFSYSQAPTSMKSILQAFFLLTSAVGNLIIVAIESAKIFDKASYDMFLYTGLMVADMLVFVFLASRYKYIKTYEIENKTEDDENQNLKMLDSSDAKSKSDGINNPAFVQHGT